MKKTFPLKQPDIVDARVLEAVKFELRKYLKRERRKKFPEGFDRWDFACKIGPDQAVAETKTVEDIFTAIDAIALSGSPRVYVEILASAGKRFPAVETETPPEPSA